MDKLSDKSYWESSYRQHESNSGFPDTHDFRVLPTRRIFETLESVGIAGKDVLEVGAGDSTILLLLTRRFAGEARFAGLDYTDAGCELLRERSRKLGAEVEVIKSDLFQPTRDLMGRFDVVYSLGLVEHFERLSNVLDALQCFLKPDGVIVTIIPNMHGILGTLTKRWNRQVYDLHNPHGLSSFLSGHAEAGLKVIRSGYLCSTNFGLLSSCFVDERSKGRTVYLWLSRLSKFLWWFESKYFGLPGTAWLSPYIFSVSSRSRRASG